MPGLVWSVRDDSSAVCDSLFWAIEVFVMPLFLVLSGYYAWFALESSDTKSFVASRARRLLRPLLFGMVVILPLDLYIWMLGFVADGLMPIQKLKSLKVPSPYGDQLWGLSHLWFLLYVFLYAAVLSGARLLRNRVPAVSCPLACCLVGSIAFFALAVQPEVVFGFQHSFFPVASKWIYSGSFFMGGIVIAVFDPRFRAINRFTGRNLWLGVTATIAATLLGCWRMRMIEGNSAGLATSWLVLGCLAATTLLAAWTMTAGLIGLSNRISERVERRPFFSNLIRYAAGASFWIYLVHHPVVALVHVDLKWLTPSMHSVPKAVLSSLVAVGWGLASYEWMIRRSALGRWIGVTAPLKVASGESGAATLPFPQDREVRVAA